MLFVSAGELAGFVVPGVLGTWTRAASSGAQLSILVAGGLVEGAALGLAQALVLRRVLPGFRTPAWVAATSIAAGLAWLLGMVPSATHATWSTWPPAGLVVGGSLLGLLLLTSIGTAQALVMPAGTPGANAWIWWTALGWCAGLVAFSVVATPLWHEGQAALVIALVGVAAGTVMAVVMAAVTGVGAVRLCTHSLESRSGQPLEGSRMLSSIIGARVCSPDGRDVGQVLDLVIDLGGGLDRAPVTGALIGTPRRRRDGRLVAWDRLRARGNGWVLVSSESTDVAEGVPTATDPLAVLVRRDIMDSPVVLADPPRRARVSDVVVDVHEGRAWVSGVDLRTAGALRRLVGQPVEPEEADAVPLSEVHLVSAPAHSAQLAVPDSMVFGLEPQGMAEVLTRLPVARARDILRVADLDVLEAALPLLHPHVQARVTGSAPASRRTRRLAGWVLHRPARGGDPGLDDHPQLRPGPRPQAQK